MRGNNTHIHKHTHVRTYIHKYIHNTHPYMHSILQGDICEEGSEKGQCDFVSNFNRKYSHVLSIGR